MGLRFEELDDLTRDYMLREFDAEQASKSPFVAADLTIEGEAAFARLVRAALQDGNDDTLFDAFNGPALWRAHATVRRKDGSTGPRKINVKQRARLLGLSEFNTWYVRGLAARLLDEGALQCQIYRAGDPLWGASKECMAQEGNIVSIQQIYDGHRARYWPTVNAQAFSVPIVPNCHHSIRRI